MRLRKRGLALLMTALLAVTALPVAAEESPEGSIPVGEGVEDVEAVGAGYFEADEALPEMSYPEIEEAPMPEENDAEGVYAGVSDSTTYAADDIASGKYENIEWVIDANGKLTVSGTGDYHAVNGNYEAPWRKYCESILSAEVTVDGMVDASHMFGGCENLTSVDLSGFDTSSVTNMRSMFNKCKNLTSVDVSGFDTSRVTDMGWMFCNCENLTSIDLSGFDTSSVTNMYCMFNECRNLTSVDVSGFGTSRVTDMGWMFSGCENLASIDVSGFDTSNVTNMQCMFQDCNKLSNIDVGGFNTSNVTSMNRMFWGCKNLISVDVSGFDTSNVTNIEAMFYDCKYLMGVDVGGFDTSNVTEMAGMFGGCENLSSIDVSGFDTSNVTNIEGMFYDCKNLMDVDVGGFDTSNVIDISHMFYGCENLTSIDVSGFDTSKVTEMEFIFSHCENLASIDVSSFDTSSVTNMQEMFSGCENLKSLDLSNFYFGSGAKTEDMLLGCNSLSVINVPCNLSQSVALPLVEGTVWRLPDGTEITELPRKLENSVEISRQNAEAEIEVIHVSTTEELEAALGSFRRIVLADGIYETDEPLELDGLENVVIQAENSGKAEILSYADWLPVVNIYDCDNIEIQGCILGHTENYWGCRSTGDAGGVVIHLKNSTEIKIIACDLYGCGTVGIQSNNSHKIAVEDCVIRDCMYRIANFRDDSREFRFVNCVMSGNDYRRINYPAFYIYSAEEAMGSSTLENCTFLNNHNEKLVAEGVQNPTMINCTFHDNAWDGQEPKEYGICLNGLTWQMDGDVLKLGYPLQFEDGTTIESTQEEPLPYSDSSLPWKKCNYQKIVKAWEEQPGNDEPQEPTALSQAVKYAPYDTALPNSGSQNFALTDGTLPEGLNLTADGRINGVPAQSGTFTFTIQAANADGSLLQSRYTLEVGENTNVNFNTYADPGYELTEVVPDVYLGELPEEGSQLMVSAGDFGEFEALYLDGGKLALGVDYTAESGSTRITILNQTLKRSGPGTHTLAMEFRASGTGELKWAAQNIVVAEGTKPEEGGNGAQGGDDASQGGDADDDDSQDDAGEVSVPAAASTVTYVVQRGDNLWKISAQFYGTGRNWRRIYNDNAAVIRDPNRLHAGQRLLITLNQPAAAGPAAGTENAGSGTAGTAGLTYTVKAGDNLYKIAAGVYGRGSRWDEIYQANRNIIADPKNIYAGQVLAIPEL